jgi:hypothetical protein
MRRAIGLLAALAAGALLFPVSAVPATRPAPWATVNLCDPAERPGAMGVRAGVPAGPGAQWIRVRVEWYDAATRKWARAKGGDGGWLRLGDGSEGVRGGSTFTFPVPKPGKVLLLRGVVRVEWRAGKTVRRTKTVRTRAGHKKRAGGNSWAQCVVPG